MIPASSAPAHRMPKLQRAAVGGWAWLDRRWVVMLVTLVFAVAFCGLRLEGLGGGPASFVVAGDQFVRVPAAPAGLPVTHGPGYDGQFFYRLSLRPWTQERTEFGITLDEPAYRQQRIVYPLVSFVVARGGPAATAWALVGWNLAAAAALGWLGAALARRRGRHALWGLAFAAYPGFVLVIARDLADLLAAALLLAGILALDGQWPILAAAALTLAGLTRESTLVVPLALAVLWTVAGIRHRSIVAVLPGRPTWPASAASQRPLGVRAVSFAVPLGVAVAWQLVLWRTWGVAPLAQGSERLGLPFAGIWQFTRGALQFGAVPLVVRLGELVLVVAAALATAWSLPRSQALAHEKLAWVLALGVAALGSRSVWVEDWAFLRALTEPYLLGTLVLLSRPDRRGLPIFAAGALLCLAVAALHVYSL
jgi:hypothetical protein